FTGVALVGLGAGSALSGSFVGILFMLLAASSLAAYVVSIVPLTRHYSPLRISAVVTAWGAFLLCISAAPDLASQPWWNVTPLAWGAFVYVLLMFTITVVIWFRAIERVGAAHAALYSNLQPFLGAVFALLLLSEPLHGLQIVGAVVLAASIV